MRIFQKNDSRIKKAAKALTSGFAQLNHSKALDGLAFGLGYVDWFDCCKSGFREDSSPLDQELSETAFRERQVDLICRISSKLQRPDGLVQYLVSGTRLTGDRKWTLDDHLAIRWKSWLRLGLLSVSGSRIGCLVSVSSAGRESQAGYLVRQGRGADVLFNDGGFLCASEELLKAPTGATPFVPYSHYVPYGVRHYEGFEILFSREYTPMWRVYADGGIQRMMPWDEWSGSFDSLFFKDQTGKWAFHPETCAFALNYAREKGISGLPVIADATPALIIKGVTSDHEIPDALKAYFERGRGFTPTKDEYDEAIDEALETGNGALVVSLGDWPRLLAETGCKELTHPEFGALGAIEYRGVRLVREHERGR